MYKGFAYIYDELMRDNDYSLWADYIEKIFSINNIKPESIADLACGTGSFCVEMAARGYEMTGIDLSSDMLSCAHNKMLEKKVNVLFVNQDITDFKLYNTVDAVVCLMDSINYITKKGNLLSLFDSVGKYLNRSGLFIFDINSPYKFEKILDNNVFYDVDEKISYIWQNNYNKESHICRYDLTFFIKEGKLFRKYDEIHMERCYETSEINNLVNKSGLAVKSVFDAFKFCTPGEKSHRIFFVCTKDK